MGNWRWVVGFDAVETWEVERGEMALAVAERTHEFRLTVPAHALSLGIVRRAVQGLRDACGDEVTSRLAVIFSELVTNAIRHSGLQESDKVEVLLMVGPEGIRGHVVDAGRGFDPQTIPERRPLQEGGFGLRIVQELASDWGVEADGRTRVWFEL